MKLQQSDLRTQTLEWIQRDPQLAIQQELQRLLDDENIQGLVKQGLDSVNMKKPSINITRLNKCSHIERISLTATLLPPRFCRLPPINHSLILVSSPSYGDSHT